MARILLIDDDDLVRDTLTKLLHGAGHEVVAAENGRAAVQQFSTSFDLVVTDILMPEMEGIETIATLRRAAPELKIIAMSGGGRAGKGSLFLDMAKRLGAAETLSKPFPPKLLLEAIDRLSTLTRARLRDPARTV